MEGVKPCLEGSNFRVEIVLLDLLAQGFRFEGSPEFGVLTLNSSSSNGINLLTNSN